MKREFIFHVAGEESEWSMNGAWINFILCESTAFMHSILAFLSSYESNLYAVKFKHGALIKNEKRRKLISSRWCVVLLKAFHLKFKLLIFFRSLFHTRSQQKLSEPDVHFHCEKFRGNSTAAGGWIESSQKQRQHDTINSFCSSRNGSLSNVDILRIFIDAINSKLAIVFIVLLFVLTQTLSSGINFYIAKLWVVSWRVSSV